MTQAIYRNDGETIDHTPGSALTGGDVVVQNDVCAVSAVDIAASKQGAIQVDGLYSFAKGSTAFSLFDPVYWDDTNNVATPTADGNTYLGWCAKAAVSGDATVDVRLDPSARGRGVLLYSNVAASAAVSNTTVETAFDKAISIPANTLKPGDVIRVRAQGIATATNSTDTLDAQLRLGTTDVVATGAVDVGNNDIFFIDFDIVIRTIGAGGTMVGAGHTAIGTPGTVTSKPKALASTALDTTAAISVNVSATWSVANAGNSVRLDILDVQLLRK